MTPTPPAGARPLNWALRLLPAGYRAEHGSELTTIALQAAEANGRLGVWREAADITAHTLRLRAGLGPDKAASRIVAMAAPLAVAIAAGSCANTLATYAQQPSQLLSGRADLQVLLAVQLVIYLLWPAALVAVWLGRWTAARLLAGLGALLALISVPLLALVTSDLDGLHAFVVAGTLPWILTGLLMAAAPRDMLGSSLRHRRALAATTVAALVPWALHTLSPSPVPFQLTPQALWLALVITALAWAHRNRTAPLALALAALPQALGYTIPLLHPLHPTGQAILVLLAAAAAVATARTRRKATPAQAGDFADH
jgi:hypothetical protein